MLQNIQITENNKIFSTDIFFKPKEFIINAEKQLHLVAIEFEDNIYLQDKTLKNSFTTLKK